MDKNLTYQQARRIRGTGVGKIFADQLEQNATVGQAFKRTISLKMQSKVKGIQEKFDPLNIARFMTFGSSWAPALLGKLTGRSHDDTRYFSGRLKPIVIKKNNKITETPKDGDQLVEGQNVRIKGINDQLFKIYKLLKKSAESDKKRREIEHNFDEEKQNENDRRHKELLKVLAAITGGDSATIIQSEKPKTMFEEVTDFMNKLGWLKNVASMAGLFGELMPLMLGAFPMLAMWKVSDWAEKADINNPNGNPFAETAKAGLEFSNWVDEKTGRSEKLKSEQQARNEERMTKGDSWEKKNAGSDAEQLKSLAPVIQNYEKMYTEAKGADKKQVEVALNSIYDQRDALIKKIGGVDAPGERITPKKTANPTTKPEKTSAVTTPAQTNNNSLSGVQSGASTQQISQTTNVTPTTPKLESVPTAPASSQKLNAVISENVDVSLPKQKSDENVTINNVRTSARKKTTEIDSLSEISVRNDEPTLMDMIVKQVRLM